MKAHKIILLSLSSFFKSLFKHIELDCYKIVLPHYSTQVISAFVQFFYTGEILLNKSLIEEFASLCHEFNCDEIPAISQLIKNHKALASKDDLATEWVSDKSSTNLSIERMEEVPKVEIEFDEYFESNDNVETIFFNENECNDEELLEHPLGAAENDCKSPPQKPSDEGKEIIKEEYLNVQYIEENTNFELLGHSEKSQQESGNLDQKQVDQSEQESLEMTVDDDIRRSHKKYGVSRSSVFKHSQKTNDNSHEHKQIKKNTPAPSISFPALAMNLAQLREEQNRFKKRLQQAINSCRDSGNSVKKASKLFGVPADSIERSLRGFKNVN